MTPRTLHSPNAIPRDLWPYTQFVSWRYKDVGRKKPAKLPVNPRTLGGAGVEWPNTWAGIHTAVDAYQRHSWLAGIGFVLTPADPFAMLDLDGCIIDGRLSPLAAEVVGTLRTYTEVSPSGQGLRLLVSCAGALPTNRKTDTLELYGAGRYCTLTGDPWGELLPIAQVQNLDAIMGKWLDAPGERPTVFCHGARQEPPADDAELWQRICAANQLASQLYRGDLSGVHGKSKDGGPDVSRAVILLLNCLAIWTGGDAGRMARMIRQTRLDQGRFDERRGAGSWLEYQIADAIKYTAGRRA
ncbi:MAG: hypothetical protein DCC55_39810 [Chloroflexi bacterium]|nr:MAG: hypothetical protein DCC55_39810 [Chloroflexota bacterium]